MALHPSGKSLVLGMTMGGIKKIDIQNSANKNSNSTNSSTEKDQLPALTLSGPEFDTKGSKFGAIKGLSFSSDGRSLALGGEDGVIEIVSWPSLEVQKKWQASEKSIRNLDFSAAHNDGVIISTDESGACKLWDIASGELITQLQPPKELPRAAFFRCKSTVDEDGIALYTPVKFKGQGYILRWRQNEDGEIVLEKQSAKPVAPCPICGFEISRSGRLLAAVTPDGDQVVISTRTLHVVKYRKGAHMTFATAVAFSPDDTAILSTSADASATLTTLARASGSSLTAGLGVMLALIGILIVLIALVVGMLRRFAEQDPSAAVEVVHGLPQWAQHLILPS
jgi:prolactin regulatory element-binding protein